MAERKRGRKRDGVHHKSVEGLIQRGNRNISARVPLPSSKQPEGSVCFESTFPPGEGFSVRQKEEAERTGLSASAFDFLTALLKELFPGAAVDGCAI